MTEPTSKSRSVVPPESPSAPVRAATRTLADLMSDGFYLLLLLKRGQLPEDEQAFIESIRRFLETVERGGVRLNISTEDIYAAKYAFCAAIDEAILSQPSALREEWERHPLQLVLFGEHLAGENFFTRLEELRAQGEPRLQALEVYYYCLLLGFEGKYRVEGPEKLGYLTARLGDEIALLKGKRTAFAPHWEPPDRVNHVLRRVIPLWAPAAVLAVVAIGSYIAFDLVLSQHTTQQLAAYQNIVKLPPRTAHITIKLP